MKKIIIVIIILGLILVAGWLISGAEDSNYTTDQATETVETWIAKNALTFTERGGSNLIHVKTEKFNENDFKVIFDFETNFSGYGAVSEDEMNAQVITPHTIAVTVKEGEIVEAVTDETYDEMEKEAQENKNIATLYFLELVDGQETITTEEREIGFNDDDGIEEAALLALLEGPTKEGLITSINENTDLLSLSIIDGVATVNFSSEIEPGGGSAWVTSIREQITATLMQFDSVNEVNILVEGEENRLQP